MSLVSPDFSLIVGQTAACELLTQALVQQRLPPAYFFVGPSGVGRALTARQFIRCLLGARTQSLENHPDLLWLEPTYLQNTKLLTATELQAQGQALPRTRPQIRLEQIRQVSRFLSRPPLTAPRSVVVIDQAETMAEAAANGLLKTLEEPGLATIILIAPRESDLLPTLVSRCQRIPFYRLTQAQVAQVLTQTGASEILEIPLLIELAAGSPGAALRHWQQWQTIPSELRQTCLTLTPPLAVHTSLELARTISQDLDVDSQIWLLDLMQQQFWHQSRHLYPLQVLESTRQHLRNYVQPRLAWEVALLDLCQAGNTSTRILAG